MNFFLNVVCLIIFIERKIFIFEGVNCIFIRYTGTLKEMVGVV